MEIHEWPLFSAGNTTITKPGMVVTVEPGIYLEGKFGLRIEDIGGHYRDRAARTSPHSPKELIIL